jgi:hypothetical protein
MVLRQTTPTADLRTDTGGPLDYYYGDLHLRRRRQ